MTASKTVSKYDTGPIYSRRGKELSYHATIHGFGCPRSTGIQIVEWVFSVALLRCRCSGCGCSRAEKLQLHPTIAHQSLANPSKGVMVGQSGLFLLAGRDQTLVTSPRPRDRINMAAGNTKSRCHCLSSPTEHQHQQPSIFSSNAHSNIHPKFKWRRDRSSTQGQQSKKLSRPIRAAT